MTPKEKSAEYYGSVEGMPEDVLRKSYEKARNLALELAAEVARRETFTSAERLADTLHKLIHFTADCDYYYSNWPNATGCRAEFRIAAEKLEQWYADMDGIKAGHRPLGGLIHILEVLRFGSSA